MKRLTIKRRAASRSVQKRTRGRGKFAAATLFFIALLLPFVPALALDPSKALTQYSTDVWGIEQGLPQSSIKDIAQTRDGYLWLATDEGLARFDGVQFVVFDKGNTAEIKDNSVQALYAARDGSLWIGTRRGLTRMKDGGFKTYTTADGLSDDAVMVVAEDSAGSLWVGTHDGLNQFKDGEWKSYKRADGLSDDAIYAVREDDEGALWIGTRNGLTRLKDNRFTVYTKRDGLADDSVFTILEDREHNLWFGTRGGLSRVKDGRWTSYTKRDGLASEIIYALYEDEAGTLWIGTSGGGLVRMLDGKFSTYSTDAGLSNETVSALYEDREGSLWVGTWGGGLNRLKNGKFTTYSKREGLADDDARTIYEDHQGALWIGTSKGLTRFKDGEFKVYTMRDGLSEDSIFSTREDFRGNLWIGTWGGGLNRFKDGKFRAFTRRDGLASDFIFSTYVDRAGNLWTGTWGGGLNLYRDGKFTAYTIKDGLSNNDVRAILEDREGALWLGTNSGLNRFKDGKFTTYTMRDGLASEVITSISEGKDGVLWIGTSGGGLARLKGGKIVSITASNGLYDDVVYRALEDDRGNLWMSCNKGIFRVALKELNDFADGVTQMVTPVTYGKADGMGSAECNGGFQPAGWRTRDGRLWFPTIKGVVAIDPEHLSVNNQPPPVIIEKSFVDGQAVALKGNAVLSPGLDRLEFHYTALSFLAPGKVQFRYKLEGFDKDWINAGTRRVAYYTNLPPGTYTFRVIASNNDGVWNMTGATLSLTLKPRFYQTKLFYLLCALALVLLVASGYLMRVRRLKRRERELVQLVGERTRQLEEANQTLQRLSTLDSLTGIPNRRHFDQFLAREWRRCLRERCSLSVFLVDVDYFKTYNDWFGHQVGDECLKLIADALSSVCKRPADLAARYGGEEFVVVCSGTDEAQAMRLAEAARARIESLGILHPARPGGSHVTISIGVATLIPSGSGSPEELVASADSALYRSKREGRNLVRSVNLKDAPSDQLVPVA